MKKFYKYFIFVLSVFTIATFVGCDLISSVKDTLSEYFKGNKKQETTQSVSGAKGMALVKQIGPDTLAQVGNWSITKQEFDDRLKALKEVMPNIDITSKELKKQVLDELIKQQMLVEEAEKTGLDKNKDIIAAVEEFRRTLIVRESARKIAENITVTDEEARSFYDQNKQYILSPLEVRVREIVSLSEEKAQLLLAQIKKGSDFAELARKESISESAARGGDLGVLTEQPFEQMMQAIIPLKEGGVSDVFQGPEGFYVIKIESKKGGDQLSFEQVKEEVKQQSVIMKQQKAVLDYVDSLKGGTKIFTNEELLK